MEGEESAKLEYRQVETIQKGYKRETANKKVMFTGNGYWGEGRERGRKRSRGGKEAKEEKGRKIAVSIESISIISQ